MTKKRIFFLSGTLIFFAFIALNVIHSMQTGQPLTFDMLIGNGIIGWRNEALTLIFTSITYLGNANTIILFCIILLFFKKSRFTYGVPLATTTLCSYTTQTIIKVLVQRPRPLLESFLIEQGGFSFPSGHSCTGLVFYGLFTYLLIHTAVDKAVYKIMGYISIVIFLCIGISRIYLGVHYPTDVLGGWSLGLGILVVSISLIEGIREQK